MEEKKKNFIEKIKQNQVKIIVIAIILFGCLIRIFNISNIPNALNCDEASAGYEAYSILNYGIDRNGNFMPSFLVAWGSGQNALLSYVMIPFIKVLGLTTLSVRLPMAILGCISLVIFYLLLKKISNQKIAIIGLTFFAICPWHVMKSRWGLESNLFPDLILIFAYLLVKGLEDKNKILYYLSFIVAGLAAYSYGTSYYFLPVFIIPLLWILVKKEKITIKEAIISLLIVGIVSLPIVLYVVINTLNLPQINLPFLTVPKLEVNRYKELTSIFSSQFFTVAIKNFMDSMKILILQSDGLPWNNVIPFGTMYIFSTIFTLIGICACFKKDKKIEIKYNYLFNVWFIVCIILTFICEPNINRLNIIMIPIVYYTVIGIYLFITYFSKKENQKKIAAGLIIIYMFSFMAFMIKYSQEECDTYGTFSADLEEVMDYVGNIENKQVYFTNNMNYIYVLFYTKYDVRDYVETVEYENKYVEFRKVNSFGEYHFTNFEEFEDENVYVINKKDKDKYNLENHKVTEFKRYLVIE